jgi:hypothetical protein
MLSFEENVRQKAYNRLLQPQNNVSIVLRSWVCYLQLRVVAGSLNQDKTWIIYRTENTPKFKISRGVIHYLLTSYKKIIVISKGLDTSEPPLYLFPAPVSQLRLHKMEDIQADTHLLGRSFFEQLYCTNNSVTTLVSPEAWYVEPGYHECYVVGVPYKESSSVWDRAHVVGIDIPPDSEFSCKEGVEELLDLAKSVFRCQPTRVYLFGLFEMGKQREFWVSDGSGVYRSGLFDDERNFQDLLD